MLREPQSHIEKHIAFLDMLQHGERLRVELTEKASKGELKAILELCLNMNEGNLSLSKRKSHRFIISTLANRDIPLSNKKKWMLRYNKMLYNIIHPALKEWKKKFKKSINKCEDNFLYSFEMAYKKRRTSRKSKRSKKPFTVSLNSRKHKGVTTNLRFKRD